MNPILPIDEYIPDGEPHVFDGRGPRLRTTRKIGRTRG